MSKEYLYMKTTIPKSDMLKRAIRKATEDKLKANRGIIANLNGKIIFENHVPCEEIDENKWKSVTCRIIGSLRVETEVLGDYVESIHSVIISADIKSHDQKTGEFTVEISDTLIIEQYP